MEDLLTKWDMPELIEKFKENEITLEDITDLTENLIQELIPQIGKRMKFTKKLKEYKLEKEKDITLPKYTELNQQTEVDVGSAPTVFSSSSEDVSDVSWASSCNNETEPILVPQYNKDVAFCGIRDLISRKNEMPEFDLKTLLQVVPYGSHILKFYEENGTLNDYLRNKLVDILVRNIYSYIMQYNITHRQYNILTAKIMQCFPSEVHTKYYHTGKKMGYCMQAKGKLVDKVKNIRYNSPDKVYLRKRRKSIDSGEPKKVREQTNVQSESKIWLKYNREPWVEVMKHWKLTFDARRDFICQTVADFIKEWPLLEDPKAESLIEYDFSMLYPGKDLLLLTHWEEFFNKIMIFKKRDIEQIRDETLLELKNYLEGENVLSTDSKVAIQLSILPRLIPPKSRIRGKNTHWKFSVSESVESLILFCQNPGDIQLKIEQQIQKASRRKIANQVQPYILVQGEHLNNIQNTYIVIDKVHFKCDSTLKALDVLFKLFYVLKITYPCQSEHIWNLVQIGIFKIKEEGQKLIPYIQDILNIFE